MQERIDKAAEDLLRGWDFPGSGSREKGAKLAGQKSVQRVLHDLMAVLFPGCHGDEPVVAHDPGPYVRKTLGSAVALLDEQVGRAFEYACNLEECDNSATCDDCREKGRRVVSDFVDELPAIQSLLQTDIVAAYEGDPAAKSTMEVVQSYPGLYAIIVHRIAHYLNGRGVPLIPRIMSESAHSLTGIDIHPGAEIGAYFFIDHGTGVVIGETCNIGEHVKLYQGVTLGALSFEKDEQGRLVKGIKRHPNVEDHVVIYAGATILGGKTTIGAHSVVGGNVWLTHSVPPHSKVYNQQPEPRIHQGKGPS